MTDTPEWMELVLGNASPELKAAMAVAFYLLIAERMRKQNADPTYKANFAERIRKRNADPTYKAKLAELLRKRNTDPTFKAKLAERRRQMAAERKQP